VEESPIGNQAHDASPESLRRDERDSVLVLAQLRAEDGSLEATTVRVRNVSTGGLMAQASDDYRMGLRIEIDLEGIGTVKGVVAWAEAGRIGIAFDHPIDKTQARKPVTQKDDNLMHPPKHADYRRPGLKPR
jgi:hypothetical protein